MQGIYTPHLEELLSSILIWLIQNFEFAVGCVVLLVYTGRQ
jgi:hypothetical protein